MSSEFPNDWKVYVEGHVNKRVIAYLEDRFKQLGITNPKLKHIKEVTLDEALNSRYPISMPRVKELMYFIQEVDKTRVEKDIEL